MAIDNVSETRTEVVDSGSGAKFIAVFLVLAALAVGEFFMMSKISSTRNDLVAQQNQMRTELTSRI